MTATILPFPRPAPITPTRNPIYWQGVEDYMVADLRATFGWPEDIARQQTRGLIEKVCAQYPLTDELAPTAGEGEY